MRAAWTAVNSVALKAEPMDSHLVVRTAASRVVDWAAQTVESMVCQTAENLAFRTAEHSAATME